MGAVRPALLVVAALGAVGACGSDATGGAPANLDAGTQGTTDSGTSLGPQDSGADGSRDSASEAGADAGADAGPFPLGATWGADAVHFRLMAAPATAVELDLYAVSLGAGEVLSVSMTRATPTDPWAADVTHTQLVAAGIAGAVYYRHRPW